MSSSITTKISELPDLVPVPLFCKALGIGVSTGYGMVANGDVPTVRIGSRIRVPKYAVVALSFGACPWEAHQRARQEAGF